MNPRRRILVLGGTRFCGRELVRLLVSDGHDVTVSSRRRSGLVEGATFVEGERSLALAELRLMAPFEIVFDFTAYDGPATQAALNAFPTADYFFVSSLWLNKMSEFSSLPAETQKYLKDKEAGEALVLGEKTKGTRTVLRLPVLMGAGDHSGRLDFYRARLCDGQGVIMIDGGDNQVEFAWTRDVATALARLITFSRTPVLLEARVKEKMCLKEFMELLARLEGLQPRLLEVRRAELAENLEAYLHSEPFHREYRVPVEGADLFGLVGISATRIEDWLSEILPTPAKGARLPGEIAMIHRAGSGAARFYPVLGLIEKVGERLLQWRKDPSARLLHFRDDFKTEADRRAHNLLSKGLLALGASAPIVSEEDAAHEYERPRTYWLVDPIDGTASWLDGFSGFVCQVAFIHENEVLFGAIHAPSLKKTWMGIAAQGAWLNGTRLGSRSESERLVLVDNYPKPSGVAKMLFERLPATSYLESGSLGLKGALVADGTADLFVKDVTIRDWDVAPLVPILEAVDASMCLLDGSPFLFQGSYEKKGVIIARDKILSRRVQKTLSGGL